jgi:hypothetical protein
MTAFQAIFDRLAPACIGLLNALQNLSLALYVAIMISGVQSKFGKKRYMYSLNMGQTSMNSC